MVGARNSSQRANFYRRSKNEHLDMYYISQSYFGLPRRSIRSNSDRTILAKQTLRDVESIYRDIDGYDMKKDEIKEMCRTAWSEKFNYVCIIGTKFKDKAFNRIFDES